MMLLVLVKGGIDKGVGGIDKGVKGGIHKGIKGVIHPLITAPGESGLGR